jgi:hypothetical protein
MINCNQDTEIAKDFQLDIIQLRMIFQIKQFHLKFLENVIARVYGEPEVRELTMSVAEEHRSREKKFLNRTINLG